MKTLAAIATLALASCSTGSAPPQYVQDSLYRMGLEYTKTRLNLGK